MPTDRLARLRALIEQWKKRSDDHWLVSRIRQKELHQEVAEAITECAAELEGVLADPPQDRPQDTYHWGEPMKQYAALGIGVEAWVELEREERRAVEQNLRDLSGVTISYRTFRLVMMVLRAIRLEDFRAAPTPADGAPQEQEP